MTGPLRISAPVRGAAGGLAAGVAAEPRASPARGWMRRSHDRSASHLGPDPRGHGGPADGACRPLARASREARAGGDRGGLPRGPAARAGALRGRLARRVPRSAGDRARLGHERSPRAAVGVRGDLRGVVRTVRVRDGRTLPALEPRREPRLARRAPVDDARAGAVAISAVSFVLFVYAM